MLTLYYGPGACSMAAHIVLEESGEKYEPKKIDLAGGEQRTEAYLKINPLGRVPALQLDNGNPLTENTAILPYLGRRFGLSGNQRHGAENLPRLSEADRRHARRPRMAVRPLFGARSLCLRFLHLGRAPRTADGGDQELRRAQRSAAQAARRRARGRGREGEGVVGKRRHPEVRPRLARESLEG